jgi:hypothetical protein
MNTEPEQARCVTVTGDADSLLALHVRRVDGERITHYVASAVRARELLADMRPDHLYGDPLLLAFIEGARLH